VARAEHQRTSALLVCLGLLCGGCLLYTSPINERPTVSIVGPATYQRGSAVTFTVNPTDESKQTLRYAWGVVAGTCPTNGALPTGSPFDESLAPSFTFTTTNVGTFCVFVTVTDTLGAAGRATKELVVQNEPPSVTLTQVAVVTTALRATSDERPPLYSRLRYKIEASDNDEVDRGRLTVVTQLRSPDGSTITPPVCDSATKDVCFTVDQPGAWTLVATVADTAPALATAEKKIDVAPDQAPCIAETSPPFGVQGVVRDANDLDFSVEEIKDDGDPLPAPLDRASTSSFAWSWRLHGAPTFTRVLVPTLPRFTFPPAFFTSGQVVDVRVEVRDRRASQTELLTCNDAEQPQCVVRERCSQWVTWTVVVL
jgi:hypothetical protein